MLLCVADRFACEPRNANFALRRSRRARVLPYAKRNVNNVSMEYRYRTWNLTLSHVRGNTYLP